MSHPIPTSLEAEVAYRRERLVGHYAPRHHPVGGVRQSRWRRRTGTAGVGGDTTAL
ncbi:MAG TPA: hypothetical protein VIC62_10445 [Nakamurella sp.]